MKSSVLLITGRFLRSRLFVIAAVLWIIASMLVILASLADNNFSYYHNGTIPDFQDSIIINVNGSKVTAFSQTFNQYGEGIGGDMLYYNLSVSSGASQGIIVDHGYAGLTDSTGYVSYNTSGLKADNTYTLVESVHGPGLQGHIDASTSIFTLLNQNGTPAFTYSGDTVSMTPVISSSHHSLYAIHVWKPPVYPEMNLSAYYAKAPTLSFSEGPSLFYFNYTESLGTVSLTYEKNVQTPLSLYGNPYYYGAVLKDNSGSQVRGYIFSTLKTPSAQAAYTVDSSFGILAVAIIISEVACTNALINGASTQRNTRTERFLNRIERLKSNSRSRLFLESVLISVMVSLPFIAITTTLSFFFSGEVHGNFVSAGEMAGYVSAAVVTSFVSAGVGGMLFSGKSSMFSKPVIDLPWSQRLVRGVLLVLGLVMVFYYLILNLSGSFFDLYANTAGSITRNVVMSNIANPVGYSWLTGSYLSRNLMISSIFSFDPSAFGITPLLIASLGALWISVFFLAPYFIFKRMERSKRRGSL